MPCMDCAGGVAVFGLEGDALRVGVARCGCVGVAVDEFVVGVVRLRRVAAAETRCDDDDDVIDGVGWDFVLGRLMVL